MGDYGVVVLDFETTGLSPLSGDRVIEVGAVLVENNVVTDRFQSLMNPGMRVSRFIEEYTGISNEMLRDAPPVGDVMQRLTAFLDRHHLVAHNASFDQRFLDAELSRLQLRRKAEFACSLLVARRLYPEAPSHSLGALVNYRKLKTDGVFHRALADAEMTAGLWTAMIRELKSDYRLKRVPFAVMQRLMKLPKRNVPDYLRKLADEQD
ncbi:3'-5' exonuclease [Geomesophilobacter sediminis]|uniref:3'-5' exonuclease n=1 Tax=Geomesophilobacter sediminis TaxID=2798584 RepID=A0A8J7M2K8_9BACT|nr:3'-5' exonuclease [Geomesophilobacter sediminis]MBJ6727246.1 3'-5' exonuclease [Geomesophilobacter sediminis]